MTKVQQTLLNLICLALGKGRPLVESDVDCEELFDMAQRHGVAGVVLDGVDKCFEEADFNISFQTKMKWIGLVSQMEQRYQQQEANMQELASFYYKHGIKMMVLKGYGLSQDYPIPNHRPCGDIDIYLYGEQEKADRLIHDELGIEIDKSHHHHTVFQFQGETIENHYDFLNIHVRKSNKRIEDKLKNIAHTDVLESTDNIIFPSVEFNAIYLLRHCAAHFASTEMTLRQILDWGLFMEKHYREIKWEEYLLYVNNEGMFKFYNLLGLFCMKYLGFDSSIFHGLYTDSLFDRFSNEIMSPEFKDHEDGTLLRSLSVKPRRWWHNRWKNRLCYTESAWEEFLYGLWAKVLKPSHFRH